MRDLLQKLKPPPPARKRAVLLPDHCFFVRVLAVAPAATPEEIAGQVELALEGLAPFPVSQLCHGYFHPPGAARALAFASYRRRFTVDDAAAWKDADAVMPAFATFLEAGRPERRALLVQGPDFITALGWDGQDAVPAMVETRRIAPDAPPEERAAVQAGLVEQLKDFPPPVEMPAPAGTESTMGDDGLVFPVGGNGARFDEAQLDALDVRNKEELADRRKLRRRNLLLWRVFAGCVAALVLGAGLEIALAGLRLWQKNRAVQVEAQAPVAVEIETKQKLADRIEELSTQRLMPIRMIEIINDKRPGSILFTRVVARDLYTLHIDGKTNVTPDVASFEAVLRDLPELESIEPPGGNMQTRGGAATFSFILRFKPEPLRAPAPSS